MIAAASISARPAALSPSGDGRGVGGWARPAPDGPAIETDRLILRLPVAEDYEPCAAFLASDRTRYMGGPRDRAEAWRSLASITGHWLLRGFGLFVFHLKGDPAPCGVSGLHRPATFTEPEMAWSLWRPDLEGRGLAFEAASAARDWAWANAPTTDFVSYIDPANGRSIALATRLGATRDDTAPHPFGGEPCHVYRHPSPEAAP